jgi:hypothetical protein
MDFPWNAPIVEIYHLPPVANLASLSAISTASAPPFVKKSVLQVSGRNHRKNFAR